MRITSSSPELTAAHDSTSDTWVCLLNGPQVTRGARPIAIPEASQRLFAYVALHDGGIDRRAAAGVLWPDCTESRAAGNLRSALWRLRAADADLLTSDGHRLALDSDAAVDVRLIHRWARRVIEGSAEAEDLDLAHLDACLAELLPGWYDDWVVFERERLRQRLLHALQRLTLGLAAKGDFPKAVEAAVYAVRLEPLRESAQRALIAAHLAGGNLVEARRALDRYAALLRSELGAEPPESLTLMVADAWVHRDGPSLHPRVADTAVGDGRFGRH